MERYQRGDVQAFEALLVRHRRGVFNFVLRFCADRHTAEELHQDVFMRVVQSAEGFKQRSRFTTWLYTIARNLCIDHLRKQKHRRTASLDQPIRDGETEQTLMDRMASSEASPDREADVARIRSCISAAVAELAEEQREVFLMREEAGLPFDEIARIVDAPVNTVKSRMRYALQNLRARLEAAGIEP
ncbi:MAG: RNA polymerase sigma factor [Deltaproteobacteria bacterium]|nr:RNA polymerase sigma factor [Deltaproteobacteria bacterium]